MFLAKRVVFVVVFSMHGFSNLLQNKCDLICGFVGSLMNWNRKKVEQSVAGFFGSWRKRQKSLGKLMKIILHSKINNIFNKYQENFQYLKISPRQFPSINLKKISLKILIEMFNNPRINLCYHKGCIWKIFRKENERGKIRGF